MRLSQSSRCIAFVCCLLLLSLGIRAQEDSPKTRIAVLNFDNPTVGPEAPSGLFGADAGDAGKGVSTQLIQKLLEGGKYTIVDRSALEKLLNEQKNADTNGLDAYGLAARIGRLLSLDAMILGGVTRYGVDDANKGKGAGVFGSGMHTRKSRAFVEITVQVFNVSSGEILAGFTSAGQSAHFGEVTIVSGRGRSKNSVEMLSSDFVDNLFGEATSDAVAQIATQLNLFAGKIPRLHIAVEGLVAEVTGNHLTLNVGRHSGLKAGDRVEILRELPTTAPAPASPLALQPVPKHVGSAKITEAKDEYATAELLGSAQIEVGDHIKRVDDPGGPPQ